DGKFTAIAKTIGAAIGGNALRDYRKPQAEKDFAGLSVKATLADGELKTCSLYVKQESLQQVPVIVVQKMTISGMDQEIGVIFEEVNAEARLLAQKTPESEIITRLVSNPDISEWVEQGMSIHKRHSSSICEYCQNTLPINRVQQLGRHFSDADRQLKADIDAVIDKLSVVSTVIQSLQLPDKARLYAELRDEFDRRASQYETAKNDVLGQIRNLSSELKYKRSKSTEAVNIVQSLSLQTLSDSIEGVNAIIRAHNDKTAKFDETKKQASVKLKNHYLSSIYDEIKTLEADIASLARETKTVDSEIITIQNRITENTAKISSEHKACEVLNE